MRASRGIPTGATRPYVPDSCRPHQPSDADRVSRHSSGTFSGRTPAGGTYVSSHKGGATVNIRKAVSKRNHFHG